MYHHIWTKKGNTILQEVVSLRLEGDAIDARYAALEFMRFLYNQGLALLDEKNKVCGDITFIDQNISYLIEMTYTACWFIT